MLCPRCEGNEITTWIIGDKTSIYTDDNGTNYAFITQGCKCKECNFIWYEHYEGIVNEYYWKEEP